MLLSELKAIGEAPEWLHEDSYKTLKKGYLNGTETPKQAWHRVANAAALRLNKPELSQKFFDLFWKNWLGLATPVFSNMGTSKGLPISCYANHVGDSRESIVEKDGELAKLSSEGGGVGMYYGDVRGRGEPISRGGESSGLLPWIKRNESTVMAFKQGDTRRGAAAVFTHIYHKDIKEFIKLRRPEGDPYLQSQQMNHGVCIPDEFMQRADSGDPNARELLNEIYKTRLETGQPYIFFTDNVNKANPKGYLDNNLFVSTTNICTEITLFTDQWHTFVCCLSSLNLALWEEWKDSDAIYLSILFLEGVMEEFIERAKHMSGFECAVRFAEKSRALGLGGMGWHTLLQNENTPVDSLRAKLLNKSIWSRIKSEAVRASRDLATELGEPEWCKGTGMRHSHLLAIAPTVSNAHISNRVSPGIEMLPSNVYVNNSAKGNFIQYNETLKSFLASIDKDTPEVWAKIISDEGSVRKLDFLTLEQKDVFKTAFEIDQRVIIDHAADRQEFICQSQSLNLFFNNRVDPEYFNDVHMEAWIRGIKTLYYVRSSSVLQADLSSRENCRACDG